MKKSFVFLCVLAVSMSAFAQKGQKAIGLNLSYSPSLEKDFKVNNFGLYGKFQYGFTDNLRGELALGYDFKDKEIGLFNAAVNFHYLFNVSEKVKIYPIVGVGYAHFSFGLWEDLEEMGEEFLDEFGDVYGDDYEDEDYGSPSKDKLLVNAGLGAEYAVSDRLSLCAEVKYQYIKDFSRLPIAIGFSYKF